MARIVQVGGSIVGLLAAMLLARDGHEVVVLEKDPNPPPPDPDAAWASWGRRGVPQFRQPHNLFPRFRAVLDEELPGTMTALAEAGCVWIDPIAQLPPTLSDRSRRADDDRFRFLTGRRPVTEAVLATAAEQHEGLDIRRGVKVAGLLTGESGPDGVPHVAGVRTTDGDDLRADLVVDAGGRRSKLGVWLEAAGARAPVVDSVDHGFRYHTRYFRGPELPATVAPPVSPLGMLSALTLPGDNQTWSLTLWCATADPLLKKLKDTATFMRLAQSLPLHAHWVEGEPITEVLTYGGVLDRHRSFVVDGRPVATGVAAVGDAWACTNPSAGRGMSVGAVHAQVLRDTVRDHLGDPADFARAYDEATERRVAPWFWTQKAADAARIAEMEALCAGAEPPEPAPLEHDLATAMMIDPEVFRGTLEHLMCLAHKHEVLARPGFLERVGAAAAGHEPLRLPAPTREDLEQIVG